MTQNYTALPSHREGYTKILEEFRIQVPIVKNCPGLEYRIEGDIPENIASYFPVFASPSGSDGYALNSGGRGVILSVGGRNLRLKGCDINGFLTCAVGMSEKNRISDIMLAARKILEGGLVPITEAPNGNYHLSSYQGKPFSFFTDDAVNREKLASGLIGESFEERGYIKPYEYMGKIGYPTILWQGQPCYTLVFGMPSMESDVRFMEIFRQGFLHMKYASQSELEQLKEPLSDFLLKLTTWYGFNAKIMADNNLAATESSHQPQNYVICHVSDSEIGAARVDHTSTVVNEELSGKYFDLVSSQKAFFGDIHLILLQSLALAKAGERYDENRYTGYFDWAYKWQGEIDTRRIEGFIDYYKEIENAFAKGLNGEPIPIPEKDLISVVDAISGIKIDSEKQDRVNLARNMHL